MSSEFRNFFDNTRNSVEWPSAVGRIGRPERNHPSAKRFQSQVASERRRMKVSVRSGWTVSLHREPIGEKTVPIPIGRADRFLQITRLKTARRNNALHLFTGTTMMNGRHRVIQTTANLRFAEMAVGNPARSLPRPSARNRRATEGLPANTTS